MQYNYLGHSAHTEATPMPRRINQRHDATQEIMTIGATTLAGDANISCNTTDSVGFTLIIIAKSY